jgi:hypothetical protein
VKAVALDLDLEPFRERVDDADTDAVQPAGDGVGAGFELAAGVQRGEDDLYRLALLHRVQTDGDATAVVDDPDAAVGKDRDVDLVAVTGQRLIDRVIHHLVDQVVQAPLAGGADVHAGALANGFKTLEDLDRTSVVIVFRHADFPSVSSNSKAARIRGPNLTPKLGFPGNNQFTSR